MIRRQLVGAGLILGILGGQLLNVYNVENPETFQTKFVYAAEGEVKEIQIETVIDWTEERKRKEITDHLPPIFLRIAGCESTGNPDTIDWDAHNQKTDDHGALQANKYYWGAWWKSEGLDPYQVQDMVQIAKHIYEKQGLSAWSASQHCWE